MQFSKKPLREKLNINRGGLDFHKATTYIVDQGKALCCESTMCAWVSPMNTWMRLFRQHKRKAVPLSSARSGAAHALTGCLLLISRSSHSKRRPGRWTEKAALVKFHSIIRLAATNGHKHTETPPSRKIISHFLRDFIISTRLRFDIVCLCVK